MLLLADAGVPMIFVTCPLMAYLIVPVILIELFVARRVITSVPLKKMIFPVTAANIGSTFIGWPVAWLILFGIQLGCAGGKAYGLNSPLAAILAVTLQAPWLIPYESNLYWMVPTATVVLMIPSFFVSVYTERLICRWCLRNEPKPNLRRFSWRANLWSYLFLLILSIVWLGISILTKKP